MDISEVERRFKAAITELGLDANQAAALGQQLVAADKAAQAAGIAFRARTRPSLRSTTGPTARRHYSGRPLPVALKAAVPPPRPRRPPRRRRLATRWAKIRSLEDSPEDLAQDADYLGDMTVADFEAMRSRRWRR